MVQGSSHSVATIDRQVNLGARPQRRRKRIAAKFRRLTKERLRANERERQRSHALRNAFESLRGCLPSTDQAEQEKDVSGATRLDLLVNAMSYIQDLLDELEGEVGTGRSCAQQHGREAHCQARMPKIKTEKTEDVFTCSIGRCTLQHSEHVMDDSLKQTSTIQRFKTARVDLHPTSTTHQSSLMSCISSQSSYGDGELAPSPSAYEQCSSDDFAGDVLFYQIPAVEEMPTEIF